MRDVAFEGPLDLLLHLIEKNKVSIFDIPIAEITDQYVAYVREMERSDLGLMSEFLVMAATLLDIKSKMLLPPEEDGEEEAEDPRQELVERLLEYKMYKYMASELQGLQAEAARVAYRAGSMPAEALAARPAPNPRELLAGVTLEQLGTMFDDALKRQAARVDPVRSKFGRVEKEEASLEETAARVESYIARHRTCSFRGLLEGKKSKIQAILTFLTILEMMKMGKVEARQDALFADITITATQSGDQT